MVAEARNFPDLARSTTKMSSTGPAPGRHWAARTRGMESGEFRKMDVETTIDVVIAPILMLLIWRYSMNCCETARSIRKLILQIHLDLLRHGLRRDGKETQV